MPSITVNEKTIFFNRLICYGCSFTGGGELGDHFLLPNNSLDEVNQIKKNLGQEKFNQQPEVVKNGGPIYSDHKGKTLAWPAVLAEYFDVDYKNRAIGGSSLEHAIYHLETDMSRPDFDFGIDIDNDLIIVGITHPNRWFWINDNGDPMKPLVSGSESWPSKKFYKEFITHCFNSNDVLYNHFIKLKYLDLLSKSLGNRILMQPCMEAVSKFNLEQDVSESHLRRFLKDTLTSLNTIIDPTVSMHDFFEPRDGLPWGHPPKYAHDAFAKMLYNRLTRGSNE
jgi:hypothetical protein